MLKNTPTQVALLAKGATVARGALASFDRGDEILTIAPLRGAMPIAWAADGLTGFEKPAVNNWIEVPLGEFVYTDKYGNKKQRSPKRQKNSRPKNAPRVGSWGELRTEQGFVGYT